jgi:hypothetical protein
MKPQIENKRFWKLSLSELQYIARDCEDAMATNPDNPKCWYGAGNYADQYNDTFTVIHYRNEHKIR